MAKRSAQPPPIELKVFKSSEEIERSIAKLERRIAELEQLDIRAAVFNDTGAVTVARSNVREAIREIFGANSPEFKEHEHLDIWAGPLYLNMDPNEVVEAKDRGRTQAIGILRGLISRLSEKREELVGVGRPSPSSYLDKLNLHPRVLDVARDLFLDGYHWEAVFAAAKALVNYVKERSGRHDLDGAPLMRAAFSKNGPALAFNELSDQTDLDEQEGMMHLFEGAVLGIRNPGGTLISGGSRAAGS
jgi:uncharacterized protein (TIGR02391 family)